MELLDAVHGIQQVPTGPHPYHRSLCTSTFSASSPDGPTGVQSASHLGLAQFQLPKGLKAINEDRRVSGLYAFQRFREKHITSKPQRKPSFMNRESPTIEELGEGINYIFRPSSSSFRGATVANVEKQKEETVTWALEMDHFLDFWVSKPRESTSPDTLYGLVGLLSHLNHSIESCSDTTKGLFYAGVEHAQFDQALTKLQSLQVSSMHEGDRGLQGHAR